LHDCHENLRGNRLAHRWSGGQPDDQDHEHRCAPAACDARAWPALIVDALFGAGDLIVRGVVGNGSTPLIKRRCIEAVGGYDESMSLNEDWKLYTQLAGVCEFDFVPEFLTGYRLHVQSASMTPTRAMEQAIADTTAWIRTTWPDMPARLFKDRAYTNALYLAFLAIRRGEYSEARRHIVNAVRIRPASMLSLHLLRLIVLLPLHCLGLRRYRFLFWRVPKFC
jgi:hypothetical protein